MRAAARSLRAPLIVVVGEDRVLAAVTDEVVGAGWALRPTDSTVSSVATTVTVLDVADRTQAEAALLLAIRGGGLLIRPSAERCVVDDLVEDLGRIGAVLLIDASHSVSLEPATWRLLHALAGGASVSVAARTLHLSIRTANRRLGEARVAFGVRTRAELLRALTVPGRVPAAGLTR